MSVGVTTLLPRPDQRPEVLVAQADLALYTAKDQGRNICVYYDQDSNDLRVCC